MPDIRRGQQQRNKRREQENAPSDQSPCPTGKFHTYHAHFLGPVSVGAVYAVLRMMATGNGRVGTGTYGRGSLWSVSGRLSSAHEMDDFQAGSILQSLL